MFLWFLSKALQKLVSEKEKASRAAYEDSRQRHCAYEVAMDSKCLPGWDQNLKEVFLVDPSKMALMLTCWAGKIYLP